MTVVSVGPTGNRTRRRSWDRGKRHGQAQQEKNNCPHGGVSLKMHGAKRQPADLILADYRAYYADCWEANHCPNCSPLADAFDLSKPQIEPRGSLEVVDWIVLDNWYAELNRYGKILGQAPPHAEIERQE